MIDEHFCSRRVFRRSAPGWRRFNSELWLLFPNFRGNVCLEQCHVQYATSIVLK